MKQVRFDLTELPFGTLSKFGLTQEMIEDLPMYVLEDICQGKHSLAYILPSKMHVLLYL